MSENAIPEVTTGDIIKKLKDIRDERRRIANRDKELIQEWRTWEALFLQRLDEQGVTKASSADGTASITTDILPKVSDWEAVYEHIQKTGDFYLLQKRPATAAFRELHASGEEIPGMEAYEQRKISLRKA